MKIGTNIEHMPFQYIPGKSSNALSLDNCASGLLKKAFSKRKFTEIDGLRKIVDEKWKSISPEISRLFTMEITM